MVACLSIVLVEDNDDLRELTAEALRADGHQVAALSCAEALGEQALESGADLFLIDLNLPGEDGFSLSRRIRQVQPLVGIIIISARSDLNDKVVGYDCGADLYLAKPVPFAELSAAIKSYARRRQARYIDTLEPNGILHLRQRELQGLGGKVRLTPAEAGLLSAFARAPAGQLETWQLMELYGLGVAEASKAALEVRITRLRKKLQLAGAGGPCIEAIRNVGYQLTCLVQVLS